VHLVACRPAFNYGRKFWGPEQVLNDLGITPIPLSNVV